MTVLRQRMREEVLPVDVVDNSRTHFQLNFCPFLRSANAFLCYSSDRTVSGAIREALVAASCPHVPALDRTARLQWQRQCQQLPHGPASAGQPGRHGRCPLPVASRSTPATAFPRLRQRYS